jgi:hypothetical protein
MSDEMVRKTMEDSEGNSIGPLAGAFPELASLTDADLEWARQQWQRGMERQLDLVSSESLPDWDRLDAMQDEDIDLSDSPEIAPEMFAKGVVRREGHSLPQSPRFQTMLARSRESIGQGKGLSSKDFWQAVADRTSGAAETDESAASRYAPFYAADYLDDEETIAEYLAAALENPNPEVLRTAVQDVLRARMKARDATTSEALATMLATEAVLRRDWDRPEEDSAWTDL